MGQVKKYDLIIVGGGAAGFFRAINSAELNANLKILILEKSKDVLSKVKVSGGGRCNVTHACFDPQEMVSFYPRGHKELLGPFHKFLCGDMMGWLGEHGVETKIENDGRIFPESNTSQTIIDCYTSLCKKHNIEIKTGEGVQRLILREQYWQIITSQEAYHAAKVLIATGSSPATWKMLKDLGHTVVPPVPSLFTLNIKHKLLDDLAGISVPSAIIEVKASKLHESGPLLITHWGLSGPSILKLSAWGARTFYDLNYQFDIFVNWTGAEKSDVHNTIIEQKKSKGKNRIITSSPFQLPKRLWMRMTFLLELDKLNWADLTSAKMNELASLICECQLSVHGKSTFKEEFVACGGIDTKEINFKSMESKLFENLYMAGEVINIDAVTGGFNFQAAWTEAYIAAQSIARD